jgi:hypothetical protein
MLRDLGVTHLHVPDYGLPVSYNSVLDRIIEDSSLSRLLYTTGGTQILHLLQAQEVQATPVGFQSVDFTPRNIEWTMYRQINLGGRKALGALGISGERLEEDGVSVTGMDVPVFHRDFSTVVANGLGAPLALVRRDSMLRIENGREYRVIFDLEGQAFIRILMIQFDASGQILKPSKISEGTERIAEIVLTESAENMRVSRRFLALPEAAYVRFGIEHVGHSRVTIKRAVLEFPPDAQRVGS